MKHIQTSITPKTAPTLLQESASPQKILDYGRAKAMRHFKWIRGGVYLSARVCVYVCPFDVHCKLNGYSSEVVRKTEYLFEAMLDVNDLSIRLEMYINAAEHVLTTATL